MTKSKLALAVAIGVYAGTAWPHGNEVHDDKPKKEEKMPMSDHSDSHGGGDHMGRGDRHSGNLIDKEEGGDFDPAALAKINDAYQKSVKPIFKKACFNCHTNQTKFPWYYNLPFAKGQIDADITEAKKHLEMGDDFPFGGHGGPLEDLKAIGKSIDEGTMPPFKYQIMHWESFLGPDEKNAIKMWVQDGVNLLEKK